MDSLYEMLFLYVTAVLSLAPIALAAIALAIWHFISKTSSVLANRTSAIRICLIGACASAAIFALRQLLLGYFQSKIRAFYLVVFLCLASLMIRRVYRFACEHFAAFTSEHFIVPLKMEKILFCDLRLELAGGGRKLSKVVLSSDRFRRADAFDDGKRVYFVPAEKLASFLELVKANAA